MTDIGPAQGKKPSYPAFLTQAQRVWSRFMQAGPWLRTRLVRGIPWQSLAELLLIALFSIWVGRSYLKVDPTLWPAGGEFGLAAQANFIWTLWSKCGDCVLWNGYVNGGAPAFVEIHGIVLHPVTVLAALIWGPLHAAKITVVAALVMAGWAQWWLARVLRLGLLPRLWSAAMVVVGGHLAGRMQAGLFPLTFSTAAISLTIAPALALALHGRRRSAVALGLMLGMAVFAGQGYMQIGFVLCILPALVVLFFRTDAFRIKQSWRELALALGLAILVGAALLVPLIHFGPNFTKDIDPSFSSAQALEYTPLNLVINDFKFFQNDALKKSSLSWLNLNYIGWVPVLLAFLALRLAPKSASRVLLFLGMSLMLIYLTSSAVLLRWLSALWPGFISGMRYASVISSLAVPIVVLMAAWGLDRILALAWPRLTIITRSLPSWKGLSLSWVILVPLLVWALQSAYHFNSGWYGLTKVPPVQEQVMEALRTETTQWVAYPFGQIHWLPSALMGELKLTAVQRPWRWKNRPLPLAYLEATYEKALPVSESLRKVEDVQIVAKPQNEYAVVATGGITVPCRAQALGGHIDVECDNEVAGTLIVYENSWSGWTVTRDGQPAPLGPEPWLSVEAPAGAHTYAFRYRPWDVPLGLALSGLGLVLCVGLWFRPEKNAPPGLPLALDEEPPHGEQS